ncbi:MAG: LysM peptidoglycan-binding domain-containing protein [Desulfitobacteriaceae bacterium]
MHREYIIQPGDNFFLLAQRLGGTCEDWIRANAKLNPVMLQVGQKVVMPEIKAELRSKEQYAEMSTGAGQEFAGEHFDEIEMEVAGVQFKVKRIGESKIPHEIHLIMPRAEIRQIQPSGPNGPTEVQIMLSNVNIVHSPRLMSEGVDKAERAETAERAEKVGRTGETDKAGSFGGIEKQERFERTEGTNGGYTMIIPPGQQFR